MFLLAGRYIFCQSVSHFSIQLIPPSLPMIYPYKLLKALSPKNICREFISSVGYFSYRSYCSPSHAIGDLRIRQLSLSILHCHTLISRLNGTSQDLAAWHNGASCENLTWELTNFLDIFDPGHNLLSISHNGLQTLFHNGTR